MVLIYVAGLLAAACLFVEGGWLYYVLLTFSLVLMFVSDHQYTKMKKQADDIDKRLKEAEIDIHNLHMQCGKLEAGNNEGTYGKAYISSTKGDESGNKKSAG